LTPARIIFVPGLKAKPPPELYRPTLLRVLKSTLAREQPEAERYLATHDSAFRLVAWTHLFYGADRDISIDAEGIERLLAQRAPSPEDLREILSWSRRLLRIGHLIGDAVPAIGRLFAQPAMRGTMREANRYLRDREGVGAAIRALLRAELLAAWRAGARVLLLGHSLGSVIAYDTLWELSHSTPVDGRVDLLVTLGSPLASHFVRRKLHGVEEQGARRYPTNVRRWLNFASLGDTTAFHPKLEPYFREMVTLGLVESIEDRTAFANYFRGAFGLNPHEAYGYLAQAEVARAIGDWLVAHALDVAERSGAGCR
jgi:hypothetical protein